MRALVNGVVQPGLVSVEIESNNYGRSDTFRADIVPAPGARWWDPVSSTASSPVVDVVIQGGFLAIGAMEGAVASWTTLIQGSVDADRWDPIRNTLALDGRDYSSKLIELSASTDVYQNQTSSDVVADLAERAGLQWDVDPTTSIIGQYYQVEHKRHGLAAHSRQTTGWDLCMRLARIERFDLWVSGTIVYFKKQLSDTSAPLPLTVNLTGSYAISPAERMLLAREAGITRGIKVTVLSWDSRQRVATSGIWPPRSADKSGPASQIQQYTFKLPNLSQDRATLEAKAYYAQIKAFQRTVTITQPGDFTLTPRQRISLGGTSSNYDQIYRIDSISRQYGMDGFRQTVTVRNRDLVASEVDGSEDDA